VASDSLAAHAVLDAATCADVLAAVPPAAAGQVDPAAVDVAVERRSRVGWLTDASVGSIAAMTSRQRSRIHDSESDRETTV
jgi:hypothetical protein